jgi:hypothetical protein
MTKPNNQQAGAKLRLNELTRRCHALNRLLAGLLRNGCNRRLSASDLNRIRTRLWPEIKQDISEIQIIVRSIRKMETPGATISHEIPLGFACNSLRQILRGIGQQISLMEAIRNLR